MEYTFHQKEFTDDQGVVHPACVVHPAVERWAWGVVYKDKTELHQFGPDGIFHQVKEIDQDRVEMFTLYETGSGNGRIDLLVPPGAKIVHLYKMYSLFDEQTKTRRKVRIYVHGYILNGTAHYNFILPDNRIVQANTLQIALTNFAI